MKNNKILPLLLAFGMGAQAHADVFISEYIEGSSNNKAIEIYNSGIDSVNLEGYVLEIYFNGKENIGSSTALSGNLASGAAYVIGHKRAVPAITSVANLTATIGFNGDDTLLLKNKEGVLLDAFGQYLTDPGSRWSINGVSTQDATIRRNSGIQKGDINAGDAFDPSGEWTAFPKDTFDGLGAHTTDSDDPVVVPGDGDLVAPCFNCPNLSPVPTAGDFDADTFYAGINTAIANLPAQPSDADIANIKALINDAAQANHVRLSYSQVWSALTATDEDPENKDNVILLYSGRSIAKFSNGSGSQSTDQDNWNREHSWPSSHGFGDRSELAYTDIHHLRPTDISVNSTRGNKDFDDSQNDIGEAPGSRVDDDSFEPRNEMKGDVARMMLYMDTRYEGEQGEDTPDLFLVDRLTDTSENALGKLCVLLEWNTFDPIDDTEINRLNKVYQYQGNRNPYVDNPQWIELIYPKGTCSSVIGPVIPPIDPPVDPPIDPPVEPPIDPPSTVNSPLILTTIFDGSLSGGLPKGVEIFVAQDIPDLSVCGIGSANNGKGSSGQEFTFPADSVTAGSFIYIASKADGFETYFAFAPDYTSSAMLINGDDAIELFCNDKVVDLFGDINVDGSGEAWEYLDSYAKRVNNTAASASFTIDNWIFPGKNVLDGKATGEEIGLGSFEFSPPELFISEYVEGGGYNKAIELVNVTGRDIDLSQYSVIGYQNGKTSIGYTISLEGMLVDQSVFVLANSRAVLPAISAMVQQSGSLSFNGDDSVVLMKGDDVVDAIGQIGDRPSQWGTGLVSTKDNTIRRKLSITKGDTNPNDEFTPATEWDGFAKDTLDDLGLYAGIDDGGNSGTVMLGLCEDDATFISVIQGAGDATPLSGTQVVVEGVVTLVTDGLDGFFIQEESLDEDGDALTSEALFVYLNGLDMPPVMAGNVLRVKGVAGEGFGKTQIVADEFGNVCGNAAVQQTIFSLPLTDASELEAVENMQMVTIDDLIVTGTSQYARLGEIVVASERLYVPTHLYLPGSPEAVALALQNENNQFVIDDLLNGTYNAPTTFGELSTINTLRTGSVVTSSTFVMDYSFSAFRLRPVGDVNYIATQRPAPPSVEGNVKVASYNVLNLFNGDGNGEGFPTSRGADTFKEYEEQLVKIVEALVALDASVIGLMEIENDGFGPQSSIAQLTDALNIRYGEDAYAFVDAGEPQQGSDAITVGILYNTNVVSLADTLKVLDSSNSIEDDMGPLFNSDRNRPSFAQMFSVKETGGTFVVNVNHLKSKGSGCGAGDDDPVNGQGSCNLTRTRAAQALHVWLGSTFADQAIMIVGDLNAYAQEDPIITLIKAGYVDVARAEIGSKVYSFSFGNQFGTLDYVLANAKAQALITGVAEWHINSDEPRVFEYADNFFRTSTAKPLGYGDTSEYRSSDHDPVIVGLLFESLPLLGDANNNGRLDFADYFIISKARRATARNGGVFDPAYDLNEDGKLDRADLGLWRTIYRASR
jgi:predicted extracellular nuclease/endonuclease I